MSRENLMTKAELRSVVVEREFPHPPEKLWRALTQPHLISEWLLKNDFVPALGHKFKLEVQNERFSGVIDCEVLVIEPNKTLSYSWNSMGLETAVTFTLTPTKGGVHLRMEQSGFRPDQPKNYGGAKYGWQNFFGNLEKLLARMD
jgi:uncharacterized protein YndB with AHSA1/START domain